MDTATWINAASNVGFPVVGFFLLLKYAVPALRAMFDEHIATLKEQRDYDRIQRNEDRQMVVLLANKIDTMADAVKEVCKDRSAK